jgi:Fe2+ or Zn2+ uptake regulation protein
MLCFRHSCKKTKQLLYCEKCGKTIKIECPHKWKKIREIEVTNHIGAKWTRFILKCSLCGKLNKFDT